MGARNDNVQKPEDLADLRADIRRNITRLQARILALRKSRRLKVDEIHFIRMLEWVKLLDPLTNLIDAWQVPTFRAHMAECGDANCVIEKVVGVDPGTEENDGWVERVLSNLSRYFLGEEISDDSDSDSDDSTDSGEGNL